MDKIIVIGGPTASGKSKLAVDIAKIVHGEIINADSMQIYKEMQIGTAKPTEKEMEGIPHHLFNIKSVEDNFSVADYQVLARQKIDEIISRKHTPIIIGGTGLYLKSVLYDYDFSEENNKVDMSKYDLLSNEELYGELQRVDLEASKTIHPNNRKRVLRALAIYESSHVTKSSIIKRQKHNLVYDCYVIGLTLSRSTLYKRIDNRVDEMMKQGLVDEVKEVLKKAKVGSTALQAIGYKELIPYINEGKDLSTCVETIKKNTRHYAKRQFTFFNNQFDVDWYNIEVQNYELILKDILNNYMGGQKNGDI